MQPPLYILNFPEHFLPPLIFHFKYWTEYGKETDHNLWQQHLRPHDGIENPDKSSEQHCNYHDRDWLNRLYKGSSGSEALAVRELRVHYQEFIAR